MENKIYGLIGLATRAGKIVSGDTSCENSINRGKVQLVIIAEDAAENTRNKFSTQCQNKGIHIRIFGEKARLGKCVGKEERAVVGLLDFNFCKGLLELLDMEQDVNGGGMIGKNQDI